MYKQIFRRLDMILHAFLLYILIVSWFILCMWQYSVWQLTDVIRATPDFSARLRTYAELSHRWDILTDWITVVEPFVATTESIKAADAWNNVISLANVARPGAGTALELLDSSVGKTVGIKNQLLSLNQLAASATAVEQFLIEPTKHSQRDLYVAFAHNMNEINQLVPNLETATSLIISVDGSIATITDALDNASSKGNFLIRPVALQLYQAVAPLAARSRTFATALTDFKANLTKDAVIINRIVQNTQRVEQIQSLLAPGVIRPLVVLVGDYIWYTLLLVIVYLLLRMMIAQRYKQVRSLSRLNETLSG